MLGVSHDLGHSHGDSHGDVMWEFFIKGLRVYCEVLVGSSNDNRKHDFALLFPCF